MSRSSWPWEPQPRRTSTPNGALDAAMRWGVAGNLDELVTLTRALTAGIPEDLAIEPWWSVTEEGCVLAVDHPECRMSQLFCREEDGELLVDYGLLELSPTRQNRGAGRTLLRNSLIEYDRLGLTYITCYANFDRGGYAWAKMGALPYDPQSVRDALREHLRLPLVSELITGEDRSAMEIIIDSASDADLMLSVASFGHDRELHLGKVLLIDFKWNAYWGLADPEHRALIARALG